MVLKVSVDISMPCFAGTKTLKEISAKLYTRVVLIEYL